MTSIGDQHNESLLAAHELSVSFGDKQVLHDVSFAVKKGDVLGLLGPNGAGKTTTMRALSGVLSPSSGRTELMGRDISTAGKSLRSHLGYLPESAPLYPDMLVSQMLCFYADVYGVDRRSSIDRVVESLELSSVYNKLIDTLSKGYRRRVSLACTILHDPDVLILDEPTDGLDPLQKLTVHRLIKDMSQDKAIIISTHILEEVQVLCNRTIVIDQGRVIEDSTSAEIAKKYSRQTGDGFTGAFLHLLNERRQESQRGA